MTASGRRGVHNLLIHTGTLDVSCVIDCKRYSTAQRLYRITAYVLKFIGMLRKRAQSPELTIQDIAEAERLWILDCQSTLVKDKNFPMWETQFNLFKDDSQIIRCGGRLQNANLPFSSKHPILLNKKHYLTYLIVKNAHRRVQHNGVKETLTEVRSKYWIVGGRSLVKSFIHKCITCRRFDGMPLHATPAPPLPEFRVNEAPPFSNSAVDFAGPLYVRSQRVSEGNKIWICLFTCCVTRAVHLELVLDLSAVTFIRCLKRFAARRGLPRRIVSDNAKTFKATAKAIDSMLKNQDVQNYLSNVGVEWVFNLEKAPWWGGIFERLIKSTKRCLRKLVGQAKFSYDEMHTAIVEIEAIINSRPLSYVGSDDTEEPLTPSHLLVGRRILGLPDNLSYLELDDADFEVTDASVQRRARHLNSVLNHFWKRWSKEYLLELREAHRHQHSSKGLSPIDVGDIVVVHDQDHPRGFWKLAKVEKLLTGKDDHVRGATLRLPSKKGHMTTLQRPLQLLYPLELKSKESSPPHKEGHPQDEEHTEACEQNRSVNGSNVGDTQRPKRFSAKRAQDRFKVWSSELSDSGDGDR